MKRRAFFAMLAGLPGLGFLALPHERLPAYVFFAVPGRSDERSPMFERALAGPLPEIKGEDGPEYLQTSDGEVYRVRRFRVSGTDRIEERFEATS